MGIANTAKSLITKHGLTFTLTRENQATYQTGGTGDYSAGTTQTFTGYGFPENFTSNMIDGARIQAGDIKLHIAQLSTDFKPEPDDQITIATKTYSVVAIMDYIYIRQSVLYTCHLRAGD